MNWNRGVRQLHRWLSVVFTLTVIGTTIALSRENPAQWISYVSLLPLALLFLSGTYLFLLPYLGRSRDHRRANVKE